MIRKSLGRVVLAFAIVSSAEAADKQGGYTSVGARSCGVYVEEKQKDGWGYAVIGAWMAGYISGYNLAADDTFDILGDADMKSVYLWMENYCRANPLSNLAKGMEALVAERYSERKK